MDYRDYQHARDAAWQFLIRFEIGELPVRISDPIREMGIALAPYSRSGTFLTELGLGRLMQETDGLSVQKGGKYYICYRGDMTPGRIRFTVAHELGHIVLGHLGEKTPHTTRNREPREDDAPMEQAANVFASRLLAPACVLHDLNAHTPERISELCDISLAAARFRAERMDVLEQRGVFGASPLERKVRKQFRAFVRSRRPYPGR
ncbi:MAG: ImmA/IrrE family metallo-endopeptidase [Pseudoflavonifractor sp.]|nr:ImmA/IrrE family metallo-endopeptidase [Pseudoflavonifractor sp.]